MSSSVGVGGETPLTDLQLSLSYAVDHARAIKEAPPEYKTLVRIYLAQILEAIENV